MTGRVVEVKKREQEVRIIYHCLDHTELVVFLLNFNLTDEY